MERLTAQTSLRRSLAVACALWLFVNSSSPLFAAGEKTGQQLSNKTSLASSTGLKRQVAGGNKSTLLKGGVSRTASPFKEDGSTETIPQGTPLNLTVTANLNSELNQVGDEIRAEVTCDLKDGSKVLLPGKWQVIGKVARVERQKRMGRDGFIELKFEKLVSPDGKWEVPLDASASTKESTAKTVGKQVLETSGYVSVGAIGGSLLSVQLTGIPLAISTYGLSVAAGAAVGGTLGAVAALRRKGDILCAYPGDEIQIRLPQAITLPAFNQEIVPSKAAPAKLDDLGIVVKDYEFLPFPLGDKKSRLLKVRFRIENHSKEEYSFSNLAVVCNHNHRYFPYCASQDFFKQRGKTVGPEAVQEATLTFQVAGPKLKYWLVLLDRGNANILSQVAIN